MDKLDSLMKGCKIDHTAQINQRMVHECACMHDMGIFSQMEGPSFLKQSCCKSECRPRVI